LAARAVLSMVQQRQLNHEVSGLYSCRAHWLGSASTRCALYLQVACLLFLSTSKTLVSVRACLPLCLHSTYVLTATTVDGNPCT
jgi:hypothetical protein